MRVWLLALVGCGRLGFGASTDAAAPDLASCGHTFCDDFERTSPIAGPWDSAMVVGGTLTLDTGTLVAQSPANGDRAFLVKALPRAQQSVHVEADVTFDAGIDGEIDLIQLHWNDTPTFCTAGAAFGYFLVRDQTGPVVIQETYVNCGAPTSSNDIMNSWPSTGPGSKHHVTIDVTMGDVNVATLRAQVDSSLDVSRAITAHPVPPSVIEIRLGTPGVMNETQGWQVRYDNVIADVL